MVKNPFPSAGNSIPEAERFPGGGNGSLLQYSCLENPMDRGTWWAIVHRVAESDMTEHARTCAFIHIRFCSTAENAGSIELRWFYLFPFHLESVLCNSK